MVTGVAELVRQQRGHHTTAGVGGQHADMRDGGVRHARSPRKGQPTGGGVRGADQLAVDERPEGSSRFEERAKLPGFQRGVCRQTHHRGAEHLRCAEQVRVGVEDANLEHGNRIVARTSHVRV